MRGAFRRHLRELVGSSAAPYGYTLTVWSSGAVAIDVHGLPQLLDVLLFVAGAIAAFLAVETFAYGTIKVQLASREPRLVSVWGHAHLLASGLTIVAVWLTVHLFTTRMAWPIAGFLATALYLVLNAVQLAIASEVPAEEAAEEAAEEPPQDSVK